jgi:hypothetical protein
MTYSAKVKSPNGLFWHKFKRVKGDLAYETKTGTLPVRVLILEDETRVEIPMTWAIIFSPARFAFTRSQMEKESGQSIKV